MFSLLRKKQIVALIIKMIQVDHIVTTQEKKYLDFVSNKLGVVDSEIDDVRKNLKDYSLEPPEKERERAIILYYLLFALSSDLKISKKEEDFLHKCSLQLGFREDMVENILGIMKKYLGKNLPENALVDEMKPFLN